MLAPAKEASRVYEARRASSRYTTTLAVHSLAFLTEKEHEPKWKREWACLERRSGKTYCTLHAQSSIVMVSRLAIGVASEPAAAELSRAQRNRT